MTTTFNHKGYTMTANLDGRVFTGAGERYRLNGDTMKFEGFPAFEAKATVEVTGKFCRGAHGAVLAEVLVSFDGGRPMFFTTDLGVQGSSNSGWVKA